LRTLWRISNHADLAGLGGERLTARWHTAAPGKRIVYLAEHPAAALLENLVHLKGHPQFFPQDYQLLRIEAEEGGSLSSFDEALPDDWRENQKATRALGDAWLRAGISALFKVPSAVCPESFNYLFNPLHRDAPELTIQWAKRIAYDRRLFQVVASAHSAMSEPRPRKRRSRQ
jgi:RES domain-containing protein